MDLSCYKAVRNKVIVNKILRDIYDFLIIFATGIEKVRFDTEDLRIVAWDTGIRANSVSFFFYTSSSFLSINYYSPVLEA